MTEPTGSFVLPEDVLITRADLLPESVRRSIGASLDDYVIERARSRTRARLADANTAELLESFRRPIPIVNAVIAFSRRHDTDPEATLRAAFPPLCDFVRDGLLVPQGSSCVRPVVASLARGAVVAGFEVIGCVQVLEDTELYRVRDATGRHGALKIVSESSPAATGMLQHETTLLERLGGGPTPTVLEQGVLGHRSFTIMTWCAGVSPDVAAREIRATSHGHASAKLLMLAGAIVDAYAALHAGGVVHGDVHPRNILIDASGRVTILDLGLARVIDDPGHRRIPRGGVAEYLEPECVRALLDATRPPPATFESDQYSVGALLFRLFTSTCYLDCSLLETEFHRAIVEQAPSTFTSCGLPAWPELEAVLMKSLRKDPAQRFRSMAEFADAIRAARTPPATPTARRIIGAFDRLSERVRHRLGADGPLFRSGLPTPPLASVNLGAAGLAWGAYRLACIESRPEWLSVAELWLEHARGRLGHHEAFRNIALGLDTELSGGASLYHARAGLHCVEAAVASAFGDARAIESAVTAFLAASVSQSTQRDLAFGQAGTLLGCALLHEARWSDESRIVQATRDFGAETLGAILRWMAALPPVASCPPFRNMGIAHGWAGVLYATLRWCETSRAALPTPVADRLVQLADCAIPNGRGAQWPWLDADDDRHTGSSMAGWCNGSAGFVALWIAAHRALGEDRYLQLAALAAWDAWDHPATVPNLCCGLTGRAYSLLALYRYLGDRVWLDRAWSLAERAADQPTASQDEPWADSLFRGDLGIAILAGDLARPGESFMPFFEPEGWARPEDRG